MAQLIDTKLHMNHHITQFHKFMGLKDLTIASICAALWLCTSKEMSIFLMICSGLCTISAITYRDKSMHYTSRTIAIVLGVTALVSALIVFSA